MSRRIIGPFNRVEGDLEVKIDITDSVVADAWVVSPLFRGFEQILHGKEPMDALVYAPRICGICGGSHLYCASSALDTAWKTKLPPNALLLRAIGQATETIQSIPRFDRGFGTKKCAARRVRHSGFAQAKDRHGRG